LPLCGSDGAAVPRCSNVLVIGQAKRYTESLVSEREVREFVGGAMYQAHNIRKASTEIGVTSPIVFAFWTTSEFHPAAKRYSKEMGLWYLNGIALAQLAYKVGMALP
jgi:restriction endonuclease Mrr